MLGQQAASVCLLGELTDEEFAALADRAARAQATLESGVQSYVATGDGRRINFEQEAIDLFERVREVRQR